MNTLHHQIFWNYCISHQSAVEHLTKCRQLMARDVGSVVTIDTTDFEAMYAYKRGDYRRCLQLSTQNVHTLWCADRGIGVATHPAFIQLLDDDIVSLTALTLIVEPECRQNFNDACISQLTMSLYLVTRCQLRLRHCFRHSNASNALNVNMTSIERSIS